MKQITSLTLLFFFLAMTGCAQIKKSQVGVKASVSQLELNKLDDVLLQEALAEGVPEMAQELGGVVER